MSTAGLLPAPSASSVPSSAAVSAVVEDCSTCVKVPSPLSVSELRSVPVVVDKVTVWPPVVMLFPFMSLSWIVMSVVDTPSASICGSAAETVAVSGEAVELGGEVLR